MAIAPRNFRRPSIDIWPGFVDALSQLLMVIIFILLVFTVGQFYLSAALSGREQALHKLQRQVDELAELLALERSTNKDLQNDTAQLSARLKSAESDRNRLTAQVADLAAQASQAAALRDRAAKLDAQLAAEQKKTAAAQEEMQQVA